MIEIIVFTLVIISEFNFDVHYTCIKLHVFMSCYIMQKHLKGLSVITFIYIRIWSMHGYKYLYVYTRVISFVYVYIIYMHISRATSRDVALPVINSVSIQFEFHSQFQHWVSPLGVVTLVKLSYLEYFAYPLVRALVLPLRSNVTDTFILHLQLQQSQFTWRSSTFRRKLTYYLQSC